MSPSAKAPTAVGLYLAGVQFLFAVGWIVYVIYLPALAEQAGLPKSAVPWLLLMVWQTLHLMSCRSGSFNTPPK